MAYTQLRAAAIITAMSTVSGAVAGTLVGLIFEFATGGFTHPIFRREVYMVGQLGAMYGGILGVILGPAAAFGFLRRVPIGRLFGQTIIGAVCGGLLGLGIEEGLHVRDLGTDFVMIIGGGVIGFSVAAARLWWRSRDLTQRTAARALADERLN